MIGILTFHSAHNYGAMLQAYALLRFLKQSGYDVEIVNYVSSFFAEGYRNGLRLNSLRNVLINIKHIRRIILRKKQIEKFLDFEKRYLCIPADSDFSDVSHINYDTIIFGSDQIWSGKASNNDQVYFGKDISCKKISYAASLGSGDLSLFQKENLQRYVSDFEFVSIRESSFLQNVQQIIGKHVDLVLDPVFLLDAEEWQKIVNGNKPNKDYALLYQLKGSDSIQKHCEAQNIEIYNIHPTCNWISPVGRRISDVGPIEFVKLIMGADVIYTDSFHAVAFSSIFRKTIIIDRKYAVDCRISSILNQKGVSVEIIDNNLIKVDFESIDYESINDRIQFSKAFLQRALS